MVVVGVDEGSVERRVGEERCRLQGLGVQQVVAAAEAGAEVPRHPLCPCERELLQAGVIGDTAITQLLHCYMYQLHTV